MYCIQFECGGIRISFSLDEIIDKIISETKISKKELSDKISEKKEELGGLVTDEGAASIVASELGIDLFKDQKYKEAKLFIKDLIPGMNNISVTGRVMRIYSPIEFEKEGKKGQVVNLILADKTKDIRMVLWGDHVQTIEKMHKGTLLRVLSGYVKEGLNENPELHVGYRGRIMIDPEDVNSADFPPVREFTHKIADLEANLNDVDMLGVVESIYPLSTFQRQDGSEGKRTSLILKDDTGSIRVVLWDNAAEMADQLELGTILRLEGAYTKEGLNNQVEVHAGGRTRIVVDPEISKEISTELPISERTIMNIVDLEPQMNAVDIFGRVAHIGDIREFTTKDGRTGQVVNLFLKDATENARTVFWNENVDLTQDMKVGDFLLIQNAYTKEGLSGETELHAGRRSKIIVNPPDMQELEKSIPSVEERTPTEGVQPGREYPRMFIKDCTENKFVEVRGTILKLYERNPMYEACPTCRRSVKTENEEKVCPTCGKIEKAIPRLLLSGILDDGSGNIRFVIIGEEGEKVLEMTTDEVADIIEASEVSATPLKEHYSKIIGKELITTGKVVRNEFLDTLELNVGQTKIPNTLDEAQKILMRLEKKLQQNTSS